MGLIGFIIGAILLLIEVLGGVILTNELTGMPIQLIVLVVLTLLGVASLGAIATDRKLGWPLLLLTFCLFIVDFIALYMVSGSSLTLAIALVTGSVAILFAFIGVDLWHPKHDLNTADGQAEVIEAPSKSAKPKSSSKKTSKKSRKKSP